MLRRILIGDNERVLVIRDGRLAQILGPGGLWLLGPGIEVARHLTVVRRPLWKQGEHPIPSTNSYVPVRIRGRQTAYKRCGRS